MTSPWGAWPPPEEAKAWPSYATGWEPPAPASPPEGRDGLAVASLVLGVLPFCAGLLGVVFGIAALVRTRRSGQKGRVMAIWGTSLGTLWLVGLIALGVFGLLTEPKRAPGGGITEAGKIVWSDLETGDCVEQDPGNGVRLVTAVPCDRQHEVEVFATFTSTSEDSRVARARCLEELNAYVGVPAGKVAGYPVNVLEAEDKATGDPAICLLYPPEGATTHVSARGGGARVAPASTPPSPVAAGTSGEISVDDLRARDCLRRLPKADEWTVPVVPCPSRHAGEVYEVHALGSGRYPGDADIDRLALGRCRASLPRFVGARAGRTGYSIKYFSPTRETWAAGDTTVICVLVDPEGDSLVGDAKGAGANPS